MGEPNVNPEGDHIEELLAQLKGIFGQLSETEQAEAKRKITPPTMPRREPAPAPAPRPDAEPAMEAPADPAAFSEPFAPVEYAPSDLNSPEAAPAKPAWSPSAGSNFTPNEIVVPAGAALISAAIFYPIGRANEAKILVDRVEKMTPKFTRVTFVVNVQAMASYDPKMELKPVVLANTSDTPIKAVFILADKALDDARRKSIISELEPRGIYFQDIPFTQIEKKALYTDMLLGMVFFYDSQKPTGGV
jgi:hypothetical protein